MEESSGFVETQINLYGWIMLVFAIAVLYGGLAVSLIKAKDDKPHKFTEEDEILSDD